MAEFDSLGACKGKTMNCYECEYRRDIPGDAHSCCRRPDLARNKKRLLTLLAFQQDPERTAAAENNVYGITLNPHGIKMGWAMWPENFDPTWVGTCNGFKEKQ